MTKKIDFESQNFAMFDNFYSTNAGLKNFLLGLLLVLGLKVDLVECGTMCVKSEVTLMTYIKVLGDCPCERKEKSDFMSDTRSLCKE